eukprot:Pgem_evm1s8722
MKVTMGATIQSKFKVMSYNTKFDGYPHLINDFAGKIKEVGPAVVGLQECQDRDNLASKAGYTALTETGNQNYIMYNPNVVRLLDGGNMRIPRDNYAERAITWGKFQLLDTSLMFWVFNTHLPHNHGEASSRHTHAKIAGMLVDKIRELGADNDPVVIVGDMNSFASKYNKVEGGGFESNLNDKGYDTAYIGHGNPGFGQLDKILNSKQLVSHNCADTGTGKSDHSSIACEFTLVGTGTGTQQPDSPSPPGTTKKDRCGCKPGWGWSTTTQSCGRNSDGKYTEFDEYCPPPMKDDSGSISRSIQAFQNCGVHTGKFSLEYGKYTHAQLKEKTYHLMQFAIPKGLKVTLFRDDNFQGPSVEIK